MKWNAKAWSLMSLLSAQALLDSSTACKISSTQPRAKGGDLQICVIEKGSEVGAHILSGAVFEPRALAELFPDWQERGAPLSTAVKRDDIFMFKNAENASKLPNFMVPKTFHNDGNYIVSMGNVCRWLAAQAEELGVEIFSLALLPLKSFTMTTMPSQV